VKPLILLAALLLAGYGLMYVRSPLAFVMIGLVTVAGLGSVGGNSLPREAKAG